MPRAKKEEKLDPKVAAMLDSAEKVNFDALEKEGFESKNSRATTLPAGSAVRGKLIAKSSYETTDERDGTIKIVPTYEIQTAKGLVCLNGAAMLNSLMKTVPEGVQVVIARFADTENERGRTVGQYRVSVQGKKS